MAGEAQLACALQGQVGTMEGLWEEPLMIGGVTKRLQVSNPVVSNFCCKFSVKYSDPRPLASVGRVIQP